MRAYFINLETSADRRAHMERSLASFPGHAERVPAVPAEGAGRAPFDEYVQRQGLDRGLRRNRKAAQKVISCWLSHVTLWERLQNELASHETALILEDDVQFPANWTASLGPTLRGAPHGWHVLKVCGWGGERARDVVDENWVVPRWPLRDGNAWRYAGSCGYIVSGSTIRHLLSRVLSQPIKDIDVAMMLPESPDDSSGYSIYEQRPGRRLLGVGGFASTIHSGGDGDGYHGDYGYYGDYASGYDSDATAPTLLDSLKARTTGPPLFEITSGSCVVKGQCVTSPNYPQNYDNSQTCKIRSSVPGFVTAEDFSTESTYDKLQIRSHVYSGTVAESGPQGVFMDAYEVFSWRADTTQASTGWVLCMEEMKSKPTVFVKKGDCTTEGDSCILSPNFNDGGSYRKEGSCQIEVGKPGLLNAEYFHLWPSPAALRTKVRSSQCLSGKHNDPRMQRCSKTRDFAWYFNEKSQLQMYSPYSWSSPECLNTSSGMERCESEDHAVQEWRFEDGMLLNWRNQCLTWVDQGDCASTFEEWTGEDLEEVIVEGMSDRELDAACCTKCKERMGCVFWVRETGDSGHRNCWLRNSPGKEKSYSSKRGGFIEGGGSVVVKNCNGDEGQQWEWFMGEALGDSLDVGKDGRFTLDRGPNDMEVDGGTQITWRLSSESGSRWKHIRPSDHSLGWKVCYKKQRLLPLVLIGVVLLQIALWVGLYAYHRAWLKSISKTASASKVAEQSESFATTLLKRFSPKKSVSSYRFRGMDKKEATVSLQFQDLGLNLKNGACVLAGVTGEFAAGKMIGILGPSGAGKTTFMNVLCGKATYGDMMGKVQVNGQECDIKTIKSVMGFVPQDDVVHERLTVRENFEFSARLRLPPDTSKEHRAAVVEDILNIMQMVHIQTSIVGGVEERGISGGQRKRVNIGLELAACPTLLFLDEPTSGLDSTSSLSILTSLKKMTQLGVTVIMVIHQPRYTLFTLFDDVLLLGKGGRTVYLGPSVTAVDYFTSIGFKLPSRENPADWLMDIISGEVPNENNPAFKPPMLFDLWEGKKKTLPQAGKQQGSFWSSLVAGGDKEAEARENEQDQAMTKKLLEDEWDLIDKDSSGTLDIEELRVLLRSCSGVEPDEAALEKLMGRMHSSKDLGKAGDRRAPVKKAEFMDFVAGLEGVIAPDHEVQQTAIAGRTTSATDTADSPLLNGSLAGLYRDTPGCCSQYRTIVMRRAVQVFRNSARRTVDSGLILGCALIAGCMHHGKMGVDKESLPFNLMIFHLGLSLLTMVSAVRVFGADRPVFWRESASGVNVASFFFGRLTVNSIDLVFQCVLYVSVYFLVCSPSHPSGYFPEFLWPCVLIAFTAGGWGYLISTLVPPENAVMGAVVFSLVFGGILGDPTTIGDYVTSLPFDLLTTLSLTRWSVQMTFERVLDRASQMNIAVSPGLYKLSNDYEGSALGLNGWSTATKVLVCEAVLLRIFGYLGLKYMNRSKQV